MPASFCPFSNMLSAPSLSWPYCSTLKSLEPDPKAQLSSTVWKLLLQDHITLADYEIHDGMGLELYYN